MTNHVTAALPVPATRQAHDVEPRSAVVDLAGALRVGVIGVGEQTVNHLLPALLTLPKVRIAALVDPLRERRDALAARLGVSAGFDSVAQLLAEGEVDAVVTGVGMNFRWAAPVRRIRALLDGGAYGRPTAIAVRHVASKPRAPMWGLPLLRSFLLAQAIHPVDLLLQLAGEPVVDSHVVREVGSAGTMVGLQLGFAGGGVGSLVCGSQAARFESRVEVATSSGATMCVTGLGELTVTGGSVPSEIGDPQGWSQLWRPSPLDIGFDRTGFGAELAAFFRAAAAGADFSPGLTDLLPTYGVLDRIEER